MPRPLLIDTDPGIDDALALLVALRAPGWRLEAVTTVAGNVPVDVATANVARMVGVASPVQPPVVARGAPAPLARPLVTATHFHGEDGLGGLAAEFPEAPVVRHPGDAADLLVRSARRWADELVVVTLGPLTNLAIALERDPDAVRRVGAVVSMGGSVGEGGNVTAAAEYNVFVDPEAAARVLGAGLPLTLVPLDVTHRVRWSAERIRRLDGAADPVARCARALAGEALRRGGPPGEGDIALHDPLAVGVALDPTLVDAPWLPVAVETSGGLTRGVTVADRRRRAAPAVSRGGCRVALAVDADRFLRLYEESLCRASV